MNSNKGKGKAQAGLNLMFIQFLRLVLIAGEKIAGKIPNTFNALRKFESEIKLK